MPDNNTLDPKIDTTFAPISMSSAAPRRPGSDTDQNINAYIEQELQKKLKGIIFSSALMQKIGLAVNKQTLPMALSAVQKIMVNYIQSDAVSDLTNSFDESSPILPEIDKRLQNSPKKSADQSPNNIAERALREHNQENGMGQEEAAEKARKDASAIEPPAHQPTAAEEAAKPEVGAPGSQGERAMEAGAEGPGSEAGQPGEEAPPAGKMPQSEPETVAPGDEEADAGRRMKQEQQQPQTGGAPADSAEPEAPNSEQDNGPGIDLNIKDQLAKQKANQQALKDQRADDAQNAAQEKIGGRQPNEEPEADEEQEKSPADTNQDEQAPESETVEPGDERDKQKQLKKQQGPSEEAKNDENADEEDSSDKGSMKGIKAETEAEIQKALTPVWQEIIDSGWEMYGVGWLITFPVLMYLLYLDWTKQGIQLPFVGKIRVVKINILQKVDAATQITLAFLCWGLVLALIFLIIYGISSL